MLSKVFSGANVGLDGALVTVEVDVSSQSLPSFTIVGLPSKAVEESKERVRAAIKNAGGKFPDHRIIINLAPADLPKEGPSYDLPIAVGLMVATGQLPEVAGNFLFIGELSLDGSVVSTKGILPVAILAKSTKHTKVFVPEENAREASFVKDIDVFPLKSLSHLFAHFSGIEEIQPVPFTPISEFIEGVFTAEFDMAEIKGQEQAKRAVEIAAAGGHNVLLKGVPGSGKTMLARAMPGILPSLTEDEAIELTKIYSITGNLPLGESIVKNRPFRTPHHTTSRIGLVGGGTHPMPGEISLAHRGVLFLDEFSEFPRNVLESLRQPIEDGVVSISRASGTVNYPAKFILVAASNPCPCGYLNSHSRQCRCLPGQILRYQKKLSGPIMDRIDLHIEVPEVETEKLTSANIVSESSSSVKKRVQRARDVQTSRFAGCSIMCNSEMKAKDIVRFCPLSPDCQNLLRQAITTFNLSARSYHKIIKISRTIADLAGEENICQNHIAEALQYRPKE